MKVRVVHLKGCGVTPLTISCIKKIAESLGVGIDLQDIIVNTPERAEELRHIGSPTVQIDGLDIEPEARDTRQFGLT